MISPIFQRRKLRIGEIEGLFKVTQTASVGWTQDLTKVCLTTDAHALNYWAPPSPSAEKPDFPNPHSHHILDAFIQAEGKDQKSMVRACLMCWSYCKNTAWLDLRRKGRKCRSYFRGVMAVQMMQGFV